LKQGLAILAVIILVSVSGGFSIDAQATPESGLPYYPADQIGIEINGISFTFPGRQPVVVSGRTLVPVDGGLFERIGCAVFYPRDPDARWVTLDNSDYNTLVIMTEHSGTLTAVRGADRKSHALDVPARMVDGVMMAPLRAVLESLGHTVDWDRERNAAVITLFEPAPAPAESVIEFGGLVWRVLDSQDGRVLILSESILFQRPHSRRGWDRSSIRQYLNGPFYDRTFSEDEKNRILETTVKNDIWAYYGGVYIGDTIDKLFLLSVPEVNQYLGGGDSARIAIGQETGRAAWWLLRTPGTFSDFAYGVILADGVLYRDGYDMAAVGGVRPAMWITAPTE
jgi:hypothetical protein